VRRLINLDTTILEHPSLLFHGLFGTGKTYILGDVLRSEAANGPVRFINIKGEDGYLTLAHMGLGEVGEEVENLTDLEAVIADYAKLGLRALGVDGLPHMSRLVIESVCGPDGVPRISKEQNDWVSIHRRFEGLIRKLRWIAPVFVATSSTDRSMNQIDQEIWLTPDLAGKQATGIGGMFDFVFLCKTRQTSPGVTQRYLYTVASNTVVRARLPRALPPQIVMPQGPGGWEILKRAMEACLKPEGKNGG